MKPQLLSSAGILQRLGCVLPPGPARTSAESEVLLEAQYHHLRSVRFTCTLGASAPELHVYHLSDEVGAEQAMALELTPAAGATMVITR